MLQFVTDLILPLKNRFNYCVFLPIPKLFNLPS